MASSDGYMVRPTVVHMYRQTGQAEKENIQTYCKLFKSVVTKSVKACYK